MVRAVVDEQGKVRCARALADLPMGLGRATVETLKRWRFEPARRDGVPVAVPPAPR